MPQVPSHPSLQAAIRHLERTDSVTLARQAELSALAAPTGSEGRRAARVAELFRGAGDWKGMRHLFAGDGLKAHAVIALDGAGLERIVHRALGSRRYRVTYRGPGGHSWAAFGVANPAPAVGRAVQRLAELPLAAEPRTTCAVVRLGGGTGLNSIPQEAWLDLDLRSEDPHALTPLHAARQPA